MKIDVNALLQLGVFAFTILGGWIAYLKLKPDKKENYNRSKCEELETRITELEDKDEKKEAQIKLNRNKINYMINKLKDKNSFN